MRHVRKGVCILTHHHTPTSIGCIRVRATSSKSTTAWRLQQHEHGTLQQRRVSMRTSACFLSSADGTQVHGRGRCALASLHGGHRVIRSSVCLRIRGC